MNPALLVLSHARIDLARGLVDWRGGGADPQERRLTTKELECLVYLWQRTGQVVARAELYHEVWGYAPGVISRAADVTVRRLRAKIELDPARPSVLLTVHGEGYRLVGGAGLPGPEPDGQAVAEIDPLGPLALGPDTNLGSDLTAFVGRETQRRSLMEMLRRGPGVVAVVGTAGMGKTRLARAVARDVFASSDCPRGGVWFVDLSAAVDVVSVRAALIATLDLAAGLAAGLAPDQDLQLARAIGARGPMLVVLDNLEQLRDEALGLLAGLAKAAPKLSVIATSRTSLGLAGQRTLRLEGMEQDEALVLLCERAGLSQPPEGLALDDCRQLVDLLGRLPLAIEFAASRRRVVSTQRLLAELSSSFDRLRSRRRDVPSRHSTLRAAVRWSWDSLGEQHQHALMCCAVFVGGFGLDGVELVMTQALGSTDAGDPLDPVSLVLDLVDASLLWTREDEDGERRLGPYVAVLEFARAQLAEVPELEAVCLLAHARYFSTLGHRGRPDPLQRARVSRRSELLRRERDNLLAALASGCLLDEPEAWLDLAAAAVEASAPGGRGRDTLAILDKLEVMVVSAGAATLLQRSRYRLARASLLAELGEPRAALELAAGQDLPAILLQAECKVRLGSLDQGELLAQRALRMACDQRRRGSEAHARILLSRIARVHGQHEAAIVLGRRAAGLAEVEGDLRCLAKARRGLAVSAVYLGRLDEARAGFVEAGRLWAQVGSLAEVGRAEAALGALASRVGDPRLSLRHAQRALQVSERCGSAWDMSASLNNMGTAHAQLGQVDQAETALRRGVELAASSGHADCQSRCLSALSGLAAVRGQPSAALAIEQQALEIYRRIGARVELCVSLTICGDLQMRLGELAAASDTLDTAWAIITAGQSDARVRGAHSAIRGEVLARQGDVDTAVGWFQRGEADLRTVGDRIELALLLVRRVRSGLGTLGDLREARELARLCGIGLECELGQALAAVSKQTDLPVGEETGDHA